MPARPRGRRPIRRRRNQPSINLRSKYAWTVTAAVRSKPLLRVGQAQHALGHDVDVHLRGAALDGIALRAEPAARGDNLAGSEAFALPAEALGAHRFDHQLRPFLSKRGRSIL